MVKAADARHIEDISDRLDHLVAELEATSRELAARLAIIKSREEGNDD